MDVDDPADSPGGPLLEAILRHSGVALVGADRAALAQALERRLAMIELLLGFDVSSIAGVRTSLARLEEEPWRRALSPFAVTQAKSPSIDLFLPVDSVHRVHNWKMNLEGGDAAEGEFRPDALPLLGAREIDGRRQGRHWAGAAA